MKNMLRKYYKYVLLVIFLVAIFWLGRMLWIKLFYYKFGRLPYPKFVIYNKLDTKPLRSAFAIAKPNNINFRECRVYLAKEQNMAFKDFQAALAKMGLNLTVSKTQKLFTVYKFNAPAFEGNVYRYKAGAFVDILLARGKQADFVSKLEQSLGQQVRVLNNKIKISDSPLIDVNLNFRVDKGMSQAIRVRLTLYEVEDSTLYRCIDLLRAKNYAAVGRIPKGEVLHTSKVSLRTANVPALEGGLRVVTDSADLPTPELESVRKVLLVVRNDKNGNKVFLYPAYMFKFGSKGRVDSRFGKVYIEQEGRVVLPAIAPDWYNK